MTQKTIKTQCCIVGGGPAGMILGYLLARNGIKVTVLEKWNDFFRDFRGDTIHPSIMNLLEELGLLEDFFKLPHEKTYQIGFQINGEMKILADFKKTKMKHPFIAFVPQWDFLSFIAKQAKQYPHFDLRMETQATDLIKKQGKVIGIKARHKKEILSIHADLVVGADGRHSTIRKEAGLESKDYGAPMDVLWFRISRNSSDPTQSFGCLDKGRILVMIQRKDYWQAGFVVKKGGVEEAKAQGLDSFRNHIQGLAPFLENRVNEIKSWEQVKSLEVKVNRLKQWSSNGVICIGDAAHAMSPVGGLGINVAIQDAVAAANILVPAFKRGGPTSRDLKKIQKRRNFAVKLLQRLQLFLQNQLIAKVLKGKEQPKIPWFFGVIERFSFLKKIPAYLIGIGPRPEHLSEELKRSHSAKVK